jgi:hypothetical protein
MIWTFLALSSCVWLKRQLPPKDESFYLGDFSSGDDSMNGTVRITIGAPSWASDHSYPVRLFWLVRDWNFLLIDGNTSDGCTYPSLSSSFDGEILGRISVTRTFTTREFHPAGWGILMIQGCTPGDSSDDYSVEVHFMNAHGSYLDEQLRGRLVSLPVTMSALLLVFALWLLLMHTRRISFDWSHIAFCIMTASSFVCQFLSLMIIGAGDGSDTSMQSFKAADWFQLFSILLVFIPFFKAVSLEPHVRYAIPYYVCGVIYVVSTVVLFILFAVITQSVRRTETVQRCGFAIMGVMVGCMIGSFASRFCGLPFLVDPEFLWHHYRLFVSTALFPSLWFVPGLIAILGRKAGGRTELGVAVPLDVLELIAVFLSAIALRPRRPTVLHLREVLVNSMLRRLNITYPGGGECGLRLELGVYHPEGFNPQTILRVTQGSDPERSTAKHNTIQRSFARADGGSTSAEFTVSELRAVGFLEDTEGEYPRMVRVYRGSTLFDLCVNPVLAVPEQNLYPTMGLGPGPYR